MSDTALTVPKDRQDVTVVLASEEVLEGSIFLEFHPEQLTVHHKMVFFLEHDLYFFPLQVKGGGTEFIHKKNIKQIEVAFGTDQETMTAALSLMHLMNVTVVFTDQSLVAGSLMAEVPVEKNRLSDCLNLPDNFLSVKQEDRILYINKEVIRKVIHAPGA